MKFLFAITMFASICLGGSGITNWTGLLDSNTINTFRSDSFKLTKAFNYGDYENKLALFVFDDTLHAGRSSDSVSCEIGYQLGCPVFSSAGVYDTSWTNFQPLDTINTLTTGTRYNPNKYAGSGWALDPTTGFNMRPVGSVDTTVGTTSGCVWLPQFPVYAPLVRFYIKGRTGNCNTFIRCKFHIIQRQGTVVRVR